MEAFTFVIAGGLGYLVYTNFWGSSAQPQPADGNEQGTPLPAPRFLYVEPRVWTSSPVDVTYRPYRSFFGPLNDPRRAHLLKGGTRVVHSGYDPAAQTNQVWSAGAPSSDPSPMPAYTAKPVRATGEKQVVTDKTVFNK